MVVLNLYCDVNDGNDGFDGNSHLKKGSRTSLQSMTRVQNEGDT